MFSGVSAVHGAGVRGHTVACIFAAGVALTGGGCDNREGLECTQAGCTNGGVYERTITMDPARADFLWARVCWNDLCSEGPASTNISDEPEVVEILVMPFYPETPERLVAITVYVWDASSLRDDDTYRFVLYDAEDGIVYADDTATGPYCSFYPNGLPCGEPCLQVQAGDWSWPSRTVCDR